MSDAENQKERHRSDVNYVDIVVGVYFSGFCGFFFFSFIMSQPSDF